MIQKLKEVNKAITSKSKLKKERNILQNKLANYEYTQRDVYFNAEKLHKLVEGVMDEKLNLILNEMSDYKLPP